MEVVLSQRLGSDAQIIARRSRRVTFPNAGARSLVILGVGCLGSPVGDTVLVNVDNFVSAEMERMLLSTQAEAGGLLRRAMSTQCGT
jgi:hypothetical protein